MQKSVLEISRFIYLTVCLLASTVSSYATDFTYNGLTYTILTDSTCSVGRNNNIEGDVVIPETVYSGGKSYTVTSIGEHAFSYCSSLNSVIIPNTVTIIGDYAFECSAISSVIIPQAVTSIGTYTFSQCPLTAVTIPNLVTSIKYGAFSGCHSLTSVTIGNSVTSVGYDSFSGCDSLKQVFISDIASWCGIAFDSHYANPLSYAESFYVNGVEVTELVVPDSVTSIGSYAFCGFKSLTSVNIGNSVSSIGDYAFYGCNNITSVSIGNSVTSIGDCAFCEDDYDDNSNLNWIECKALVPPIIQSSPFTNYKAPLIAASEAYKTAPGWKEFETIAYPYTPSEMTFEANGLKYEIVSVNDLTCRLYAVDDAVVGDNLLIPENVEYRNRKFTPIEVKGILIDSDNSKIKSVTIPDNVTQISDGAIMHASLEKLNIETSVANNILLLSSVDELVIAPSVREFSASLSTNSIRKITMNDSDIALTTANLKCEVNEVYLGRNVSEKTFAGIASLEKVDVSDKVTSIAELAFWQCRGLTSIAIPSSVSSIGGGAFQECRGLMSIRFEDGEDYLSVDSPFSLTTPVEVYFGRPMYFTVVPQESVEKVEFGQYITLVRNDSFKNASAIRTIISHNPVPPTTDDTFSNETYLYGVLYVPATSVEAYQAAGGWKNFWEIKSLGEYSGVNEIVADDVAKCITVRNGAICVSGNKPVRIVALNGINVYDGFGDCRVNVTPGIYVVIIDNTACKVIAR